MEENHRGGNQYRGNNRENRGSRGDEGQRGNRGNEQRDEDKREIRVKGGEPS